MLPMKTKVLIVDDDRQTCEMIQAVLASAGMDASYLTDSRVAAARLHAEKMDLLFLDLHMPAHGGFDLLQNVRKKGMNQKTPVVMITGDQDPKVLARGFQAGANYFLFKPFELNRLMRVVRASESAVYRERRRYQRVTVSRHAAVISHGDRIDGATIDVSLGGMMFRGDRCFDAGTPVEIELNLGVAGARIHASGRVARALEDRSMGVEFTHLSPKDSEKLQEFLLPLVLEPEEPAPPPPAQKAEVERQ
jgi:CheY-like chemotaxis protein